MTDEKRFPPPGNEVGYREAALPLTKAVDAPAPPEGKKHVVATLAEPPDMAGGHAEPVALDDGDSRAARAAAIRRNQRVARVVLLAFVAMLVALVARSWILRDRSDRLIEAKRRFEAAELADKQVKFACAADIDCVNSCSQGAVSRQWLDRYTGPECDDGCANQLALPPQCIHGECVAFWTDPVTGTPYRNEWCTKKKK